MAYSDNNHRSDHSIGTSSVNIDQLARAMPAGSTEAGRRLTEALTARFPKTADEALPAIEYRVGSLRALRPCTNLGEAIELARRGDTAPRGDAASRGDASSHWNDDSEIVPDADSAPGPDAISRDAAAARVRTRAPKALYLNGEAVLTTPRFWWSLFVRCGLSESVFRYFDPAEVFDRVASVDAGRSIRFAIEGDAARGGARKLLAVTSPNGPILDRSAVAEIIESAGAGIVIPPGDGAKASEALGRLLSDGDLRAAMAANARDYATRVFDVTSIGDSFENVVREAAAGHTRDKLTPATR